MQAENAIVDSATSAAYATAAEITVAEQVDCRDSTTARINSVALPRLYCLFIYCPI